MSRDDAPQFASEVAPLVSCLMISRGDVFPARHAIACFLRQTHANRELVIVINGPGSTLVAAVAELGDARIRVIELAPAPRTLGELRNIAVANARGEYVCSWDDDDLHAPERIAVQLNALLTHAAAGCVLSRLTLWWPAAERLATSGKRAWEGSILALKRALPEYPPLSRGEDTEMLDEFIRHAHVVSLEAPELYVYVRHGSNTVGATHFARIYNYSLRRWVNAEYRQRLEALAESLPVREYAAELPAEDLATFQRDADVPRPTPLVSIVVRSMGRPELHRALQSLVAQDYPALDIVVVDATGGKHPPLPNLALREGHSVRMVGGRERLLRPHAANVGLAALRGEWFGFLDDDDTFDAKHVSDLIHASATHPEALVVYGTSRSLNADNEVIGLFGLGFNRWVMQFGPILLWPAALIRRTVIDRGCRFDERLEICEDRDFLAQIAALGDFAFVPCVNFNYRPDLGTSGTGRGANRDDVRRTCYDELLRAKWIGSGVYHTQRAMRLGQRAREAHARGDAAEARSWLRRTLQLYPDDPNALNGLGYLCLEAGELDEAETLLLRALEVHPVAGDYRINLAKVLERSGRRHAARRQALAAVADPSTRASATLLLTQLGEMPPRIGNRHRTGAPSNPECARTAPCPCGSGKRYKKCCGRLGAVSPSTNATDSVADRAVATYRAGDAAVAVEAIANIAPATLTSAKTALACGDICTEFGRYEQAYDFLGRAGQLGEAANAVAAVGRLSFFWYKPERDASLRQMVRLQLSRLGYDVAAVGTDAASDEPLHIIGALGERSDSALQAVALAEALACRGVVQLWSTNAPLPEFARRIRIARVGPAHDDFPARGHLIFVGIHFEYGTWLDRASPARITLHVDRDALDAVVARLVELEDVRRRFALDLSYPSATLRDAIGLPGTIEYPPVDCDRLRPSRSAWDGVGPLVIGRHGRDAPMKVHPNDGAFNRGLVSAGHVVRIAGGSRGDAEFLGGLDCFVHREHPHASEAAGTALMEAMATALPVVAFTGRVGVDELIEHGRNGFLVDDEEQALHCISALAADAELRRTMGAAARATILALVRERGHSIRRPARAALVV